MAKWYEDLYNRQIYFDLYAEEDTQLAAREVACLKKLLQLTPGQFILDVCCGYGRQALVVHLFRLL
jgi:ubiquinone/menaquinone biosynthesis C-methylase UbiE